MRKIVITTALAIAGVSGAAAGLEEAPLYTITAVNANGAASFDIFLTDIDNNGPDGFSWSLDGPVDLMTDDGDMVATLDTSDFSWSDSELQSRGPMPFATAALALNFSVTAGALDTNFFISAGNTLSQSFIIPVYEATAAVTVTDTEAGGGSATLTGNGVFAPSVYNFGFDSTDVGGLVTSPIVTGLSLTDSEAIGPTTFGSPINTLFANFAFSLSANDLASGTSFLTVTDVVPAPSSAALLGLGGLAMARRRR